MTALELKPDQIFRKPGNVRWLTFISATPITKTTALGKAGDIKVMYSWAMGTKSMAVSPSFNFEVKELKEVEE